MFISPQLIRDRPGQASRVGLYHKVLMAFLGDYLIDVGLDVSLSHDIYSESVNGSVFAYAICRGCHELENQTEKLSIFTRAHLLPLFQSAYM
jgi:hypothetical protein